MGVVVECPQQQTVVLLDYLQRDVGPADVPELYVVVVATHQAVLLVGVVVDVGDGLLWVGTRLETEFLTMLSVRYFLEALS